VDVEPLDPRDSEWAVERPAYRVLLWRPLEVPRPAAGATPYQSRAYRLLGADDVHEVLRWAGEVAAAEETCVVYLESTDAGSPGVLRLVGTDPTEAPRTARDAGPVETPPGYLDPEQLDLEELAMALQDQGAFDLHRWVLDRTTGAVVLVSLDIGLEDDEVDLEDDRWVSIEPIGSGVWYGDMADFADGITDDQVGRRLGRALRGKGAFRRFKTALYDGAPELVSSWHAFHDARARRRAVEWLWDNDLVTDEAAEAFYARHPDPELP